MAKIDFPSNELSEICRTALEESDQIVAKGDISIVDFSFEPPCDNHSLWKITKDGKEITLGHCRIKNSDALLRLKEWIERAIERDNHLKKHNFETCNIECRHDSYLVMIHHKGWSCPKKRRYEAVSSLIIIDKIRNKHAINCLCFTEETLGRIYKALICIAGKKISDSLKSAKIEKILINYL